MAIRPIFRPVFDGFPYVESVDIEFEWHPGFSKTQAQKSIKSLHQSAEKRGISPLLEISSKSTNPIGVSLSAFNLPIQIGSGQKISVECAYQGSKIFEKSGPYEDLYLVSSREAKKDPRIRKSGEIIAFCFQDQEFPICPIHAFYDWLYISALWQNLQSAQQTLEFNGFSDIAFNPTRSFNCQARSAALFVSLYKSNLVDRVIEDRDYYLNLVSNKGKEESSYPKQLEFPDMKIVSSGKEAKD